MDKFRTSRRTFMKKEEEEKRSLAVVYFIIEVTQYGYVQIQPATMICPEHDSLD